MNVLFLFITILNINTLNIIPVTILFLKNEIYWQQIISLLHYIKTAYTEAFACSWISHSRNIKLYTCTIQIYNKLTFTSKSKQ